jgi:tetratricopeptide (TPR) repeat protein
LPRPLVVILLLFGVVRPGFSVQDADDAWKDLILQGTYADADQKDHSKAEQIFLKALHEAERFGPNDVRVGSTLNKLGLVYQEEKRYADAESAFRKALPMFESTYGAESVDVANINYDIGSVLLDSGKAAAAIPYLQKSLNTFERLFGGNSVKIASVLCMIGDGDRALHNWSDAEQPLKRCSQIREVNNGLLSPELGDAALSLAEVYRKEGKYGLADPQYKLAEKIRERTVGIMSPGFADVLEAHASMLREMGRDKEADKDSTLAAAIRRNQKKSGK